MDTYNPSVVYNLGDLVVFNGKLYSKDNDSDQSTPDDVAGGWTHVTTATFDSSELDRINASFNTYEQRVQEYQQHKAQTKQTALEKLNKLGITTEELEALLN